MKETDDAVEVRLEEAAQALEALAAELRSLKPKKTKKGRRPGIQKGDRIEMVRPNDPHRGRMGEVLRRRGTMFWNLRLDADATRGESLLYRMDSSLRVL